MYKDGYLVQLHLHTSETSRCGRATGAEMARACKAAGYDTIVITDHFFNANIGCDKNAPWAEKVDYLFRGYESAKKAGDEIGLNVLFGWETYTNGPEYLTYGLGKEFLLANPDIDKVDSAEYLRRVNAAGGFVIHAHPFRTAPYITPFAPDPEAVEAFEVYNHAHIINLDRVDFNEKALEMAEKHGNIMVAGCDAHTTEGIRGGAMRFPRPITTNEELISAIRAREGEIVEVL